ncbi:phage repressor protein [Natrinema soli]|uniref:Phage repressor protein n=1 Tax=Natrinema soli TaxID=1930624 RepID=A0ABD5SVI8_9EURY|nr:phage repressor protein [Natrinema soli]
MSEGFGSGSHRTVRIIEYGLVTRIDDGNDGITGLGEQYLAGEPDAKGLEPAGGR